MWEYSHEGKQLENKWVFRQTVTALACLTLWAHTQYATLLFVFKAKRLQTSCGVGAPLMQS